MRCSRGDKMDWQQCIRLEKAFLWENEKHIPYADAYPQLALNAEDVDEAAMRLKRFAPLIMKLFPETEAQGGLIESPLREIAATKNALHREWLADLNMAEQDFPDEKLYLKCDSHLAVAGSVKARGGIYEVLKHTEELAMKAGFLAKTDNYAVLAEHKDYFSQYTMQVGSTGNLGMSIGIMSAALGYKAVVHMSADAKQWKKDLLRSKGVIVKEYKSDYSKAVEEGRKLSDMDPKSYFVDDEHSEDLFLGYAVAAERLQKQLAQESVVVDAKHPLYVYIPCGVGGAPGGITFGLKNIWKDNVKCYFVEPTQAPCMLVGLASGKKNEVCVQDYGLTGQTKADGLAVGRASKLVADMMEYVVDGIITVCDEDLNRYLRMLYTNDEIIIEPSSCASFAGYKEIVLRKCVEQSNADISSVDKNGTHILWATGGSFMPREEVEAILGEVVK